MRDRREVQKHKEEEKRKENKRGGDIKMYFGKRKKEREGERDKGEER